MPVASAWTSRAPESGAERSQVDMAFLEAVVAGDEARDHAGVGRLDVAADQGHPRVLQWPLAKLLEHVDMGMAAADQHQISHQPTRISDDVWYWYGQ